MTFFHNPIKYLLLDRSYTKTVPTCISNMDHNCAYLYQLGVLRQHPPSGQSTICTYAYHLHQPRRTKSVPTCVNKVCEWLHGGGQTLVRVRPDHLLLHRPSSKYRQQRGQLPATNSMTSITSMKSLHTGQVVHLIVISKYRQQWGQLPATNSMTSITSMKSLHTGQVVHLLQAGAGHQQTPPAVKTATISLSATA